MSHVSVHKQIIQNIPFFLQVCEDNDHEVVRGEHTIRLFGSNAVNCVGSVKIKEWNYSIAVTAEGELKYDNFGSQPNSMDILGLTLQDYNKKMLESVIPYDEIESHYSETLDNGDIRLVVNF